MVGLRPHCFAMAHLHGTTCAKHGGVIRRLTLHITGHTNMLQEDKKKKTAPSMKNAEGEGNRKDGEGQKGELPQDGRGGTSGEGASKR